MLQACNIRDYCLSKNGAFEDFPFGVGICVFKVCGKMFALLPEDTNPPRFSLKCEPELAVMLRAKYGAVIPGYHLNKRHWNTITADKSIPEKEILKMIDHSYDLVVKGLKKADREKLSRT